MALAKVEVYSESVPDTPTITFDESGSAVTDPIQIRNINGLDPVKTSLNTSALGALDGEAYIDSHTPARNIVLTLRPNPDFSTWTFETLRQFIYSYFIPKNSVKLVFDSDEVGTVYILGKVESVDANPFSKDPEFIVSIICFDPYFTASEPTELSGLTNASPVAIANGGVGNGIYLKVSGTGSSGPTYFRIIAGSDPTAFFQVTATATTAVYFDLDSRPRHKLVREVNLVDASISNRFAGVYEGSSWPVLPPGPSNFQVLTDDLAAYPWELTYFKRFGGL